MQPIENNVIHWNGNRQIDGKSLVGLMVCFIIFDYAWLLVHIKFNAYIEALNKFSVNMIEWLSLKLSVYLKRKAYQCKWSGVVYVIWNFLSIVKIYSIFRKIDKWKFSRNFIFLKNTIAHVLYLETFQFDGHNDYSFIFVNFPHFDPITMLLCIEMRENW